jgi:TRAP-type C4-dicarboxylate transport system permease small subunit
MMQGLVRAVGWLSKASGIAAALCLLAACAVVCQMVFMRYVLVAPTIWQTEFVLYAVVAATLLGSPWVLNSRGHVSVDILPAELARRGHRRLRGVLAISSSLLGASFCALLAVSGTRYFHEAWASGWVTESVWAPPLAVVLAPLPIGLGLLCLQYLVELLALLTGAGVDQSSHAPGAVEDP